MTTTPRAIRISDELWAAALAKADERGDTVSEIVRKALTRYVKSGPPRLPPPPPRFSP